MKSKIGTLKSKIGIFGGTFDPFTIAHREIVKQALENKLVDYVYICPTIVTWHRENYTPWLDDNAKLKVIEAMVDDECFRDRVFIDEDDLKLRRMCEKDPALLDKYVSQHRFIDTLIRLKLIHDEGDEFYPIIGSDEYVKFKEWYAYDSILKQSDGLIVVTDEKGLGRDGKVVAADDSDYLLGGKVIALPIDSKFREVSASKLRKLFTSYENYIACARKQIKNSNKEVLCHTPIFDVVRGHKVSNGLKPILIDAPDWVSIMVMREGMVLVEKQFRYGADDYVEEFPCGMVEEGEDPLDAAVRELEEETGIKLLDKTEVVKLGQTNPNPAFMTNKMHYFFINLDWAKYDHVDQKLDEHEEIEWYWKDKNRFMFDLADDAHVCGKKQVPAIALSMVKLYENSFNYPSCG